MREIVFFRLDSGRYPVKDFLDSLSGKQAQKIVWVMQLIEELLRIPKLYFKKLVNTDDIWEIRIQLGSDIFRVLGFFESDKQFIATNGFKKKTHKTPQAEINLAEKRKITYNNQRGH